MQQPVQIGRGIDTFLHYTTVGQQALALSDAFGAMLTLLAAVVPRCFRSSGLLKSCDLHGGWLARAVMAFKQQCSLALALLGALLCMGGAMGELQAR